MKLESILDIAYRRPVRREDWPESFGMLVDPKNHEFINAINGEPCPLTAEDHRANDWVVMCSVTENEALEGYKRARRFERVWQAVRMAIDGTDQEIWVSPDHARDIVNHLDLNGLDVWVEDRDTNSSVVHFRWFGPRPR